MALYGILRSDARWYAGTADREPQWGSVATPFRSCGAVEKRAEALGKAGHVVEVIPILAKGQR